jgi:hypothetical protein
MLRLASGKDATNGWEALTGFDAVVVPASNVRHMAVSYLAEDGTQRHASPPATPWQRVKTRGAALVRSAS